MTKRILCFRRDSAYLGWFEGVVCWKMNCQEENSSLIWTVGLKARTQFTYFRREWSNTSCPQLHIINSNFTLYLENAFKAAKNTTSVTNFNMVLLSSTKSKKCRKTSTYRSHDCSLPVKRCREQKVNVRKWGKFTGMWTDRTRASNPSLPLPGNNLPFNSLHIYVLVLLSCLPLFLGGGIHDQENQFSALDLHPSVLLDLEQLT